MRFDELHLIRYGRFENCNLAFPTGGSDLQIILGPNEAGKSTTLSAVGDLLFGFGGRTRFAFRFDQKLLRVGGVVEAGGTSFEVRRRKGNVDTVLGPDDQPIDPSCLSAHLDGQSRESFERMFGLDHARLRAGGKAILDNKDDVGAAIFAAGSGLVQVARICEALDAEAKDIWARNAGDSRRYNKAHTDYQTARAKLREVEVRPSAWTKARKELESAETALAGLRAQRAELSQRRRTVHRQQLVLTPSARRQEAMTALSALGGTPELSTVGAQRCEAALEDAQRARTEIDLAKSDIERIEAELEGCRTAPELLAVAPAVDELRERKGAVDQGVAQVAALQARRLADWARVQAEAAEIGWTEDSVAALRTRLPGRPAIAELRDLLERRRALDTQAKASDDAVREAEKAKTRSDERLDAMAPTPDPRGLQDVAREVRAAAHGQALQQAEKNAHELEQMLVVKLRALAPWTGDLAALRALAAPADEDVEAALARLGAAQDGLETEADTLDRETARLEQLQLDRTQAVLAHPAPSPEDLAAARRERDSAWDPLKAHLVEGAPLGDPATGAAAFEGAVVHGDRVADERFAAAEHAGGLGALERDIQKSELLVTQAGRRKSAAEGELASAQGAFRDLVAPLGISLSPEAYPAWRDARGDALQTAEALDEARQDLTRSKAAAAAARQALLVVLQAEDGPTVSLQGLLAEADRKVEAAAEARSNERELRGLANASAEALERARTQAEAAADADAVWQGAWTVAVVRGGLAADANPAAARSQLEIIETLRTAIDDLLELDSELEEIQQSATAFAARVLALAREAGLPAEGDPAEVYVGLRAETTKATQLAGRAGALESDLEQAQAKARDAESRLATAQAALAPLTAILPGGDAPALRDLLVRATEAGRLRAQIEEAEGQILSHGDSRGLPELLSEVADAHPDALARQLEGLDGELEVLNDDFGAKSEVRQAAKLAFDALDDRPDAAIAAFEMEEARSEMAYQAELYVRKRAEARLLRSAIERYRKEKQGPLLARASALFATLTLGAFSRLIVDYDEDSPRLAGVRSDGATVVPVDGMSEGTVDQLFLALRIAAVEDAVAQGVRLPFVADDLFINFDDERAGAAFKVLAELAEKTQVLFFTHHAHLADVAAKALHPAKVSVCGLARDLVPATAS
ncbi:MAG TPA: AAA family ATPase [Caulobacteraceae bacterium]|jgi:uncharacterized protein YhaN